MFIITKTRSGQKNQEKAKISQKYHSIIQRYHYRPAALKKQQTQISKTNLQFTQLNYLTCNLTVHIISNFYLVHSAMKNMYYILMYYLLQLLLCLLYPFFDPCPPELNPQYTLQVFDNFCPILSEFLKWSFYLVKT